MTAPVIFDRPLLRRRLRRRDDDVCRFVAEQMAAEIRDRLALIKRDFQSPLVAGPFAPWMAPLLDFTRPVVEGLNVEFDDEAFPFADGSLDCIVSIFSLQTVNDLPGSLAQMRRALQPDGLLLAALFAGETLHELRSAWLAAESELTGGATLRVAPMIGLRELGGLLQRAGFALPVAGVFAAGRAFALPRDLAGWAAAGWGRASAAVSSSSHASFMQSVKNPGSGTMLRQDTADTHITPL